jgi:outer membrane protein assembly factor BamB
LFFSFLTKSLKCVYKTKYGIASIVHDGKYLSVSANILYCYTLDDSGTVVWQHNLLQHSKTPVFTPFPVSDNLVLTNNTLCIGLSFDTESYLCGLDFYTGVVKWKYTSRSSFNVYGDRIYSFASVENQFKLSIIKAETGDVKYIDLTSAINIKSAENSKFHASFDFIVQDDFLYYCFHSSGDIGVIDLKKMQEVWHDSIQINSKNWQIKAPLVVGKRLYIACEDTTLLVYKKTG